MSETKLMRTLVKLTLVCLIVILLFTGAGSAQTVEQNSNMYRETYRPQFHYSPPCGWMNDPNGLVYYAGEYHLFYQFNPNNLVPGPMHWGHAVSTDLIHWETLPIALYPDDIGPIWSGSVVVDEHNTSGLVTGGGLVALYSYQNQSLGVACSTDKGRSWTKYADNPVIEAQVKDFRDPKVLWHEPSGQWAMVIAAGQEIQFFTSHNLLTWEFSSSFAGGHVLGIWEVPDLFPLEIEGQTKWVLLVSVTALAPAGGGGIQYFVGDFDGRAFTNDNPSTILWLDYGPDNYAGTTWNNTPDDKRIYIGWMSNWQYAATTPTPTWRGAMTLPREFRLVRTSEGIWLTQSPVEAVGQLREFIGTRENLEVSGEMLLEAVHSRTLEIIAVFEPGTAERFGIDVHRGGDTRTRVVYNSPQSQLLISRSDASDSGTINNFTPAFGAPVALDKAPLRLHIFVDESSVEVFAQDGLVSLTSQTFANRLDERVALFAEGGAATVSHLEIYALADIWSQGADEAQQVSAFGFCH